MIYSCAYYGVIVMFMEKSISLSFVKFDMGKSTLLKSFDSSNFLTKRTRDSRVADTPARLILPEVFFDDVY